MFAGGLDRGWGQPVAILGAVLGRGTSVLRCTGRGIAVLQVVQGGITGVFLLAAVESTPECILSAAACPFLQPCLKGHHPSSGLVTVVTELVCRNSPLEGLEEGRLTCRTRDMQLMVGKSTENSDTSMPV